MIITFFNTELNQWHRINSQSLYTKDYYEAKYIAEQIAHYLTNNHYDFVEVTYLD